MRRYASLYSEDLETIYVDSTTPLRSRVDIGPTVRRRTGDIMQQIEAGEHVLLMHQKSLPQVWLDNVRNSIQKAGYQSISHCLPDGEEAKSLEQLIHCWDRLQHHAFTRNDCLVAIGGGAVTDVAGFCAATYQRGLKLILLPTTLLSQVDASIGGKTGINLPAGKNQLGSFYFPNSVIVDPDILSTLSASELKSGMGEIVKYACIEETIAANTDYKPAVHPLYRTIADNFSQGISVDNPYLVTLISICIRMKLAIVLSDPYEERLRRCLNLGHTIAHALEKESKYGVSHGEAVTIGTAFAFRLSVAKGLIGADELGKVEALIGSLSLPSKLPPGCDREKLMDAVVFDKKRSGSSIKFVLPETRVGSVNIDTSISIDELAQFIRENG
jgi:3-dehydroquinate synthase